MATRQIGVVLNTTDPVQNLQIKFYHVNAVQVDLTTALTQIRQSNTDMAAEIATMQATLAANQTDYNNFIAYLTSIGVTDVTKPLTAQQMAAIAAAYPAP